MAGRAPAPETEVRAWKAIRTLSVCLSCQLLLAPGFLPPSLLHLFSTWQQTWPLQLPGQV